MAFNVNELRYASFNPLLRPVASPAYFEAYFDTIPVVLQDDVISFFGSSRVGKILNGAAQEVKERLLGPGPSTNVRFRVQAADLPQRQLEVQPRFTNGPQRMIPFGAIYATTVIDVIESDQYDMRRFFDEWMGIISGQIQRTSEKENPSLLDKALSVLGQDRNTEAINGSKYKVQFYDDCTADFVIIAFAANGLPQAKWTLKECYPVAVNATQMNWANTNQYVSIPVELSYHEWEFKELNLIDALTDPAYAGAVIRGGISAATSTFL